MTNNLVIDFEQEIGKMETMEAGSFGKTMVVAPHPDDETLGCGGTTAALLRQGYDVHFVFVSDGTMSHPNSKKYPKARLRSLREKEAVDAVKVLGGREEHISFLALPDRDVPGQQSPYFESAVRLFISAIRSFEPETIFIPWRNDPHPDHRASYQLVTEAVSRLDKKPLLMQYPIWFWEMGENRDVELIRKMRISCVDISPTLAAKQNALLAHQSQITDLIDDDQEGFRLSPEVIAHFNRTREIFFENINDLT
ncbi:PIG-L deacetylase family protein [Dyadobacter bucti]|uniref:PIG-L deacetylase family protein n=1 Tax=Dyadobacter bucti TaxID=2572203 RepID=UPI003F70CEF2